MAAHKKLHLLVSFMAIIAVFIYVAYDTSYLRQNAIYALIEETKSENSIDSLLEQAENSKIHISIYNSGPSLGPSCDTIRFCFDHKLFDHADEVFAFAPRSFPFEFGRVLRKCDRVECHWIEHFGVYLEPASYSERDRALKSQDVEDIRCETYYHKSYSGRYCRQDTISEGMLVETLIFMQVEKPKSYGFLMFDQHYVSTGSWRINFLTGEVKTSGAAAL